MANDGVTFNVDKIVSQLAQKLGPELTAEITRRQKGTPGGGESSSQSSSGKSKPKEKKESLTDKTANSYREGGSVGSGIEQDTSELRSGRFSGIIGRKIDSAKKIKDKIQEQKKKREEQYGGRPDDSSSPGGMPNVNGGNSQKDKIKYNILEVKEAKITNLHMKGAMGGSVGGGVRIPGMGGGGGGSTQPGATVPGREEDGKTKAAGNMSKAAMAIPFVGAAIGGVVAAISSMAGMHQQAKQAQEGTFGAYGDVARTGNGIVRAPELAQLSIARARVLGGKATDQNFDNSRSELGARFGVTQGIGGTQGAEMFAKMEKYGGFGGDQNSLKKIMADGIRSGFGGLRQSEFMQQVSGISEGAYNSGMGMQSADQVAGTFSNLRGAGIRDNRLGSVYGAMNDNMTKEGGQMNSMLVAHHMQQNGGDYLAAMASAEEGMGSQGNTSAINQMTQGMDAKTKAIWLKKQGIITATEGQASVGLGKDLMDVSQSTASMANEGATAARETATGGFQTQIQHANQLDAQAMGSAFEKAYEVQNKIFNLMVDLARKGNETVAKLASLM